MPRKLLPMVTSLLLCGAATAALIVTNANAASSTKTAAPIMVALADGPEPMMAAPPDAGGGPPPGMPGMGERRAAMCGEISARTAGRLAYLEARLDLTAAQKSLFDRWKAVKQTAADRRQDKCETAKPMRDAKGEKPMRPSPVDRLTREEDRLKQRLADINAERPALGALYASLSDDQKAKFGRGGMHRMHGRMDGPGRHGMGGMGQMRGMQHMPPPPPSDAPPPQ